MAKVTVTQSGFYNGRFLKAGTSFEGSIDTAAEVAPALQGSGNPDGSAGEGTDKPDTAKTTEQISIADDHQKLIDNAQAAVDSAAAKLACAADDASKVAAEVELKTAQDALAALKA